MAERASKAREGKQIKNGLREKTKASGTVGIIQLYKFMLYSLEPLGRIIRGKKINGTQTSKYQSR